MSTQTHACPIRPVTRGPKAHFFGYYDTSPWNEAQTHLLTLEAEAVERMPRAWVWERVEGARVVLRGAPGAPYELRVELTYPDTEQRVVFEREGVLGPEGVHLLRVPYATDAPNGDGVARSGAQVRIAGVPRTLVVPEEAVRTGAEVLVD